MSDWFWPAGIYTKITQFWHDLSWNPKHSGVDVSVPLNSPIYAPRAGTILSAGMDSSGYGNLIKIKADNGDIILLGHLSGFKVTSGENVSAGQEIATSGNTGSSTGPHLHFEIRTSGNVAFDPATIFSWITGGGSPPSDPGTPTNPDIPGSNTPVTNPVIGPVIDEFKKFFNDLFTKFTGLKWEDVGQDFLKNSLAGSVGVVLLIIGIIMLAQSEQTSELSKAIKSGVDGVKKTAVSSAAAVGKAAAVLAV